MTLALLLTAVGGAWAEETVETTLWEGTCTEDGVEINSTTVSEFNAGDVLRVYVTIPDGGANFKIVYKGESNFWEETTIPSVDNQWPWLNGGDTYMDVTFTEADITALTGMGIYIYKGDQSTITKVTLITPAAAAPTDVEVTTNKAENETTFTEASFNMPAYDATADYELVRDMGTGVGVKVNGNQTWGETAASILVKKENGEYPAASTLEVALTDVLESNATIESSNYTWKLQRLADDGQTWTDLTLAEAKLSPGTYCIVATAADGTPYDGECDGEFTIYENYDLTLSPATDAHLKSVTVAGTAKTADEKGVIKNIEPGKKVKITTTGPDYIIRKATVKKTVNMKTLQIGGETTATIYYIEGESWTDAITNHPTENAGWKAFSNQITYDGSAYVLFYGGSTTKVNPGEEIDSTKSYKLES